MPSLEGIDDKNLDSQLAWGFAKAVFAAYYLANKKYVASLSFFQNVPIYFKTDSKTGVKIISAGNLFQFIFYHLVSIFVGRQNVAISF